MDDDKTKEDKEGQEDLEGTEGDAEKADTSQPSEPSESSIPSEPSQPDTETPAEPKGSDGANVPNGTVDADVTTDVETVEDPKEEVTENPKPSEKAEITSDATEAVDPSAPSESSEPSTSPIPNKDVKGAYWYVVHTYSGHEAKVAATLKQRIESQKLEDKILEILVPTQEKIEIKEGKKNTIREKIFPGYILIKMILDDYSWLAVRTTPGITSFVGNANKPTPLPPQEVESIQRFISMEAPKFKTTFSVGEAVKIVDGPFNEFLGSVQELDEEKGKVKVLVSIFGRETPVELDFLQIAKL